MRSLLPASNHTRNEYECIRHTDIEIKYLTGRASSDSISLGLSQMWTAWSRLELKQWDSCQRKKRLRDQATDTQRDYSAYIRVHKYLQTNCRFSFNKFIYDVTACAYNWKQVLDRYVMFKYRSSKRSLFLLSLRP